MSKVGKILDKLAVAGVAGGTLVGFSSLAVGVMWPIALQFNDHLRLQQVIRTDLAEAYVINARMQTQQDWINKGLLTAGGGLLLAFAGIAAYGRRTEEDEATASPQSRSSSPSM